ncbi:hypothetical protein E4T39_06253 [Aureobasidium subglaciale]|nr:hypothetical protein E4T39_06253 [Aureobasidium subglaciale]
MSTSTYAPASHAHILEMFISMQEATSSTPPVLETYEASSYTLLERRQFTDMVQLANHLLFIAQLQTDYNLASQVQNVIDNWTVRGEPSPEQFIYETADLFASVGYRFRVVQWQTKEQAFDVLATANTDVDMENADNALDAVFDGIRIADVYRSFIPWTINSYAGEFHTTNNPEVYVPKASVYRNPVKPDYNCVGIPNCSFCTKVLKDLLRHDAGHWDPRPCVCANTTPERRKDLEKEQIDTMVCNFCGSLATDEDARMRRSWEHPESGHCIHNAYKSGKSEMEMATFANNTAIQMQRDITMPDMTEQLTIGSKTWDVDEDEQMAM